MKFLFTILIIATISNISLQSCVKKNDVITSCTNTGLTLNELRTINKDTKILSFEKGIKNTEVTPGALKDFSKIENLYLTFDNIKTIRPGSFEGLLNLKQLYLTNNELEYIQNGVFDTCTDLKILHLNLNKIKTIENGAFNNLHNLQELDVSSNQLDSIPNISELKQLKSLNLAYNNIKTITSGTFTGLTHLTNLILSDNKISELPDNAFKGLTNLNNVNLKSNYLKNVDARNIVKNSRKLRTIALSLNDINCNDLKTIIVHFQQANVEVVRGVSKLNKAVHGISCT